MVAKKTVLDCINVLMFNGKTISNTEFFKGKGNADKMWTEAISVVASTLIRWAEENQVGDTLFKEVTENCKLLSGVNHRFITTALYDEALEITKEKLKEKNRPKFDFEIPSEPEHGRPISHEINTKVVLPWWKRVRLKRGGSIMDNMPTEEQIKWMADKLHLDAENGDDRIVIKCFLNDYKYAKDNGKALLTKISVVDGKAMLSYVGEEA